MAKAKRTAVICQPCHETVLAEDMVSHAETEEHNRNLGPWRIQSVVERQSGWRCPGRPFAAMLPSGR